MAVLIVAVEWTLSGDAFGFTWRETGGPAIVVPSNRKGFGSRLLERIVPGYFGGSATLAHEAGGVAYTLTDRIERDDAYAVASNRTMSRAK